MNSSTAPPPSEPFTRVRPDRTEPIRSMGGLYRTAHRQKGGKVFGGATIQTTEDAVVAAVRTGYRIADAQIERGAKIARELRGAAERAGAGDASEMLESGEGLGRRALFLALEWVEALAAPPDSPIKRALSAQYRMLGATLGLDAEHFSRSQGRKQDAAEPEPAGGPAGSRENFESPPPARPPQPKILIGGARRAVELKRWRADAPVMKATLRFRLVGGTADQAFDAPLRTGGDGRSELTLNLSDDLPEGRWKAAICNDLDGELVGMAEIEL
ncbi:hypothetical protein [Variovorax saccharolyticus]|uniref:hypothetical protein n=1 Tax=Variovorax saccharolyticus TaxID=3053516 RepID=UPI002575A6C9|nr:hypothetical protein [Variovorax sp. J31P216]MDM0026343.1 hypothetical protein [Variovorax sp. J31P216]